MTAATALVATGKYTGNGTSQSIAGLNFKPDLVLIKGALGQTAVCRIKGMENADANPTYEMVDTFAGSPWIANGITSLDSDGFTVGSSVRVNSSTKVYYWMAMKDSGTGDFAVGSYTGDGTDDRNITTTGITTPRYVWVMGGHTANPEATWAHKDNSGPFGSSPFDGTELSDNVQALNSGFQVGTHINVNKNNELYFWAAWKDSAVIKVSNFIGNGLDNRSIAGVGFAPTWVILGHDADRVVHRGKDMTGDNSIFFSPHDFFANEIQALEADGFQVGTSGRVNSNGATIMYLALLDYAPNPVTPVSNTAAAPWEAAQAVAQPSDAPWEAAQAVAQPSDAPWEALQRIIGTSGEPWESRKLFSFFPFWRAARRGLHIFRRQKLD